MRCLPLVADHYRQLDGYLRSTRAEIHSRLKNGSLYIEFSDENKCYYNMGVYRTKSGEMEFFPRVTDFFIDKNASRYVDIYAENENKKFFLSWNWAAFFFGVNWMCYRKMYKNAVFFAVL